MNLPNHLSIVRVLLVALFVSLLFYYSLERAYCLSAAAVVFLFACITDALDGFLAKRLNQRTVLGSYLDPIADKLLLVSGFLSLTFMPHLPEAVKIPVWLTVCVITRDFIILIGAAVVFLTTGKLKAEPLMIGKVTTVLQMTTLFLALSAAPPALLLGCFILTAAATGLSGLLYIKKGQGLLKGYG